MHPTRPSAVPALASHASHTPPLRSRALRCHPPSPADARRVGRQSPLIPLVPAADSLWPARSAASALGLRKQPSIRGHAGSLNPDTARERSPPRPHAPPHFARRRRVRRTPGRPLTSPTRTSTRAPAPAPQRIEVDDKSGMNSRCVNLIRPAPSPSPPPRCFLPIHRHNPLRNPSVDNIEFRKDFNIVAPSFPFSLPPPVRC
ncbi:hypothetical protein C8F04DRAFT_1254530 [Mycena alexandri]|uniref:Uncharacterized protein n=1 Tax=Mycena alexandri TaxID=1745969 RepID=A0AAD6T6J2_9AGAR|nr:hypothetical protein C8F04DRAFT_1254530 [Mycena alexandri]